MIRKPVVIWDLRELFKLVSQTQIDTSLGLHSQKTIKIMSFYCAYEDQIDFKIEA